MPLIWRIALSVLRAFGPEHNFSAPPPHIGPLQPEELAFATAGFECRDDQSLQVGAGHPEQLFLLAWLQASASLRFLPTSDGDGKAGAERVAYGGLRNVLTALCGRQVRIVLMTAIGVTNRDGDYNRQTEAHDWKRRSERLVRASGLPYTIVRPGWFDYHKADEHHLVFLQGDRRHSGNSSDGVIARRQIADVWSVA